MLKKQSVTNRPTDRQTDRVGCRVACPRQITVGPSLRGVRQTVGKQLNSRAHTLTRPYTRAEVACGWAGAAKKQSVTDRPTDRQTDRVGFRVACTRLKTITEVRNITWHRLAYRLNYISLQAICISLCKIDGRPNIEQQGREMQQKWGGLYALWRRKKERECVLCWLGGSQC